MSDNTREFVTRRHAWILSLSVVLLTALSLCLMSIAAFAQTETSFLSIPSSGFTPQNVKDAVGYDGNQTGTARRFQGNFRMYAPVNLPHGATVNHFRCGGRAASNEFRLIFTLRRNEPQQANVDMATVMTDFEQIGFQFVGTGTTPIVSPVINNATFNYYIVAETSAFDVGFCSDCSVGFCRIRYTVD